LVIFFRVAKRQNVCHCDFSSWAAQLHTHEPAGCLFRATTRAPTRLHFLDNSSDTPRLVFKDEAGQTTINDAALYQRLRREFAR
jgi:hypothetical protein